MSSKRWIELDKQYLWHPFTSMRHWQDDTPVVIERGEGNYLIDTEGKRYLDGVSSLWVTVHGHAHPAINKAVRDQLDRISHTTMLGLTHPGAAELGQRLVELCPGDLSRVFYSDNGSTAVEIALKLAFQHFQLRGQPAKRRFIHLEDSYHGDTLGAVSVGGIAAFHQIFGPLLLDTLAVPAPHPYRHPAGPDPDAVRDSCLAALADTLERHGHEVAALIVEPLVQGAAGILVHPPGFLAGAARLCREHDVLLIADEVATGFGRTGTMFACEHEDVTPDFLCLAKGITGGYLPLAATVVTNRVYETFLSPSPTERRAFFHGHTYTGHPLGCAAALANLDLFRANDTLNYAHQRSLTLTRALGELLGSMAHVGDIRQRGLMCGIELVADRASKEPFAAEAATAARVCAAARTFGVIVRNLGDVIVLMPPLSITDQEIAHLVDSVARAIDQICP